MIKLHCFLHEGSEGQNWVIKEQHPGIHASIQNITYGFQLDVPLAHSTATFTLLASPECGAIRIPVILLFTGSEGGVGMVGQASLKIGGLNDSMSYVTTWAEKLINRELGLLTKTEETAATNDEEGLMVEEAVAMSPGEARKLLEALWRIEDAVEREAEVLEAIAGRNGDPKDPTTLSGTLTEFHHRLDELLEMAAVPLELDGMERDEQEKVLSQMAQ